jgi:hypothetical protein
MTYCLLALESIYTKPFKATTVIIVFVSYAFLTLLPEASS